MLRTIALFLLPIALLATACGGFTDGATGESGDDSVETVGAAGPDGIYNTADDSVVGDASDRDDLVDALASFAELDGGVGADDDSVTTATDVDDGSGDTVVIDDGASDPGFGSGSLDDNAVLGALNPFAFISGDIPDSFSQGSADPKLGAVLLTSADVPSHFRDMGEFSYSTPSEFGDMAMVARMFATSDDADEAGAMIMSAAMTLPPEAMGELDELDELMGLTEADFVDLQEASDGFGMEFADLEILNADGLGDSGFGTHMEIDFGALFSVFGAPEDDSVSAGIAMDMYAFAVRDQVLVLMVMWPMGESPGVDALALAEIMASRV